mgnify:CR=1 FL=1
MAALQMQGRASAPSEEKYLSAWAEMGFPADTVSEAYDRTILHCMSSAGRTATAF